MDASSSPGLGSPISMDAKYVHACVLKFRCTFKANSGDFTTSMDINEIRWVHVTWRTAVICARLRARKRRRLLAIQFLHYLKPSTWLPAVIGRTVRQNVSVPELCRGLRDLRSPANLRDITARGRAHALSHRARSIY